jgi:DNA polymerase III subunit delta'
MSNICGHEINRSFLDKQVLNLTAQSFAFIGPEMVGRRLIARDFAKKLMCHELIADKPCEKCSSCLGFNKGLNPDFLEIAFVETNEEKNTEINEDEEGEIETISSSKRKPTEAKEIKVKQIEPLLEFLEYKPQISQVRVAIIDNAERLNIEAWSSLLKTIEEPPPKSILIFLITDIQRLPETIVSRVLQINFKEIASLKIEEFLKETNKNISDLNEIAWRSRGLPGLALNLTNNKETLRKKREMDHDFLELLKAPFYKQSPLLEKLSKLTPSEIEDTILEWLFILQSYLEGYDKSRDINLPKLKYNQTQLASLASDLSELIDWNKRSGINKRLWLENTFLKVQEIS